MKSIDQHITFLLSSNDCVIIPNFGAFIAEYKPATIDQSPSNKPHKSLLFNTRLTRNDGLLINTLVENEGFNYKEAKQEIEAYVNTLNSTLEQGESYTIEGAGTLQLDKAGFIQFHEDIDNTCHLDSYGLPTVKLKKIQPPKDNNAVDNKNKILDYTLKTAAAVILILVVYLASQPSLDTSNTDQASLSFISDTPKILSEESVVKEDNTLPLHENTPINKKPQQTEKEKPSEAYYHVIIGSLSTRSAAQLHLNLYRKNYPFEDITIIQGNDRFRISAAHFSQTQEASAYIKTLKHLDPSAFKSAWILHQ